MKSMSAPLSPVPPAYVFCLHDQVGQLVHLGPHLLGCVKLLRRPQAALVVVRAEPLRIVAGHGDTTTSLLTYRGSPHCHALLI